MALLASWCVCKKTEWDFKRRLFEDGNGWKRSSTAATTSAASPPISPPINRRKEGQSWKKATKKYQKKHTKSTNNTHICTNKASVRPRRQLAGQLIGGSNRAGKSTWTRTQKQTQIKYQKHTKRTQKVPKNRHTKSTKEQTHKKYQHGLVELKKVWKFSFSSDFLSN